MAQTGIRLPPARRLAAVLFADIVGFTSLTAEDDARAFRMAALLQQSARDCVGGAGGRVVRFVGDSVLAEFPSAESAVRAAFELQSAFEAASGAEGAPCLLRTGVHVGELTEGADGDIYGDSVNLAARLQSEAQPRQVLISDDVWRQLRGRRDFEFEHAGSRWLKGISEPVTVHGVRLVGEPDLSGAGSDAQGAAPALRPVSAEPPKRAELAPTRLIVLPFRMLRPDPDTDFLSFGLADAITATLSGLRSLVVRSSLAAQRYGAELPDLQAIAREAAVDLVLAGTLMRAGDRVRVTAQLTDAATGTVLWSESQQAPLGDLFQLQDELTQRVVNSVATPLTTRERRLIRRDVPATARAFELYLRGNQVGTLIGRWDVARDLYEAALDEDPEYAPAWARVGRCYRLLAKYNPENAAANRTRAEDAFNRALTLNPDLPLAHSLYAQLEVESGRPREAMTRLLNRVRLGAPDANLLTGLVHALRYCGLLEESLAAHRQARRVDPTIRTSVEYTFLVMGRYEEAIEAGSVPSGGVREAALVSLGRVDEARAELDVAIEEFAALPGFIAIKPFLFGVRAALDGDIATLRRYLADFRSFPDLEGHFVMARWLAHLGAMEESLEFLSHAVPGYFCDAPMKVDPWFESVRTRPQFALLVEQAAAGRERALTSFLEMGGPELIGDADR